MRKQILALVSIFLLLACNSDDNSNNTSSCCGEDAFIIETNNLSGDTEIVPFNVITPNGDRINDVFVIGGLAAYPNNYLRVFSSDNTLVFETENYHLNQVFGAHLINDSFVQKVFTYELTVDNGNSFKAQGIICAVKTSINNLNSCRVFNLSDPLLN